MSHRYLFLVLMVACAAAAPSLASAAQTQPAVSRQIFLDADLNKDGFVDLEEFHKDVVNGFHTLDHNRDGYITLEEIRAIPDKGRVDLLLAMLKTADKNSDGRLSFLEVIEVRMAYFDQADTNKDERLSLGEVISFDAASAQRIPAAAPAKKK
jgi:hypothetical protein